MISHHNPILLAKFASDELGAYSLFETSIRKGDPEGALERAKSLFDLAIVFKRVKKHLAIRNHHTIELLLDQESWFVRQLILRLRHGSLANLPSFRPSNKT
jgi:hypothetical protein